MDTATSEHGLRLEKLIEIFAAKLGYKEVDKLKLFARFHDIGKYHIPEGILLKPGPLSLEEQHIMRTHSLIGCQMAKTVATWILRHHEWWNGKGYPMQLKGENIPLECRILAILDAYDAMTNDRPYREKMSSLEALTIIERAAGQQFDPQLVSSFINLIQADCEGEQLCKKRSYETVHECCL